MSKPELGFIGLGVMGTPMATHLAAAGYTLTLHDADAGVAAALAQTLGGHACAVDTPAAVGERSDIVITMLPNGDVVREVTLGPSGLVHTLKPGALLLDTSSAQPWITRETAAALQATGVAVVDAPVSGAQWGAQAAELVFMVVGDTAAVQRVRPLLECMGRAVFHLGALGCGHPGGGAGGQRERTGALGRAADENRVDRRHKCPWGKREGGRAHTEVGSRSCPTPTAARSSSTSTSRRRTPSLPLNGSLRSPRAMAARSTGAPFCWVRRSRLRS